MSVMGDMQALKMRMIVMMMMTTTMMMTTMRSRRIRRQMTGNMQALVMELKNLVEQCLASERAVQVGLCGWGKERVLRNLVDF